MDEKDHGDSSLAPVNMPARAGKDCRVTTSWPKGKVGEGRQKHLRKARKEFSLFFWDFVLSALPTGEVGQKYYALKKSSPFVNRR